MVHLQLKESEFQKIKEYFFSIPKVEDAREVLTKLVKKVGEEKFLQGLKSEGFGELFEKALNNDQAFFEHRGRLILSLELVLQKEFLSTFGGISHKGWFRDLRGVPCPLNSIKARVEIGKMPPGETLTLWLDEGSPIENVPSSIIAEGHQILEREKRRDFWQLKLQKRKA